MIWGSTSELSLAMIRAGLPASAWARSRSMSAASRFARWVGCDDQLVPVVALRVARQQVEERAGVFAELAAAGEEAQVGVEAGRRRVVVAGRQVHVAADAVVLAAHHQRRLAVGLEADDSVDDVNAGFLEHAGLVDVVFLVEPGLQLDECRHLLAVFGGPRQRRDDRVRLGRAVQGHLDRQRLRIFRGLFDELDDRSERLVGMMNQDVVVADGREDVLPLGERAGHLGLERGFFQIAKALDLAEGLKRGEVDRAGNAVDVARLELERRRREKLRPASLRRPDPRSRAGRLPPTCAGAGSLRSSRAGCS